MKIYTSYFKNIPFLEKNGIIPVAICRYPPDNWSGYHITEVAPTPELLSTLKGKPGFLGSYLKILRNMDIAAFMNRLENISEDTYKKALVTVFSEPPVDDIYEENVEYPSGNFIIPIEEELIINIL